MRQRLLIALIGIVLFVSTLPAAAQDTMATAAPAYDPSCATSYMRAYMSGWEYNHRGSEGIIDVVAAAQVARGVYKALFDAKISCQETFGGFKQNILRSMRGDYPPEDLARLLSFVDEAVGNVDSSECAYTIASQFVRQVDWGDMTAVQIGRTISEIFRTVRDVIPDDICNPTFDVISEVMSHIEDMPPDGTIISSLYKVVGEATDGHYISDYSCDYILAKTFLQKVEWNGLDSAHIVQLVSDTFKITYKISSDGICDSDPALAIAAMLLDDAYRFPPDASVIQNSYDAAIGNIIVTPEATPIVN